MFSAGETVTVIRPAPRDRVGDRTGGTVSHTIEGCSIAQQSNGRSSLAEVSDRRDTLITAVELLCPPGADIRPGDKVTLPNGLTFDVDGQHWQPHNPFTGWEPGVIVSLKGVF